jgi:hypothetical protein
MLLLLHIHSFPLESNMKHILETGSATFRSPVGGLMTL